MKTDWEPATVIENRQLTERHFALRMALDLKPFQAGQFVRAQIESDGEKYANPYSLVNAPGEEHAEIYFNIVPEGKVSNGLAALQAGDTLEISQPAIGFFMLSEVPDAQHLWMMATGTGVGPYLSILKTETPWQRFEKLILVHAVPYQAELTYQKTIGQFQNQHPEQFNYIPVVSRETIDNTLQGRIPQLIEIGELEKKAELAINKDDSHVMLCGNSGMLKDTKAILKERDMQRHLRHKPGHISSEQYF